MIPAILIFRSRDTEAYNIKGGVYVDSRKSWNHSKFDETYRLYVEKHGGSDYGYENIDVRLYTDLNR